MSVDINDLSEDEINELLRKKMEKDDEEGIPFPIIFTVDKTDNETEG